MSIFQFIQYLAYSVFFYVSLLGPIQDQVLNLVIVSFSLLQFEIFPQFYHVFYIMATFLKKSTISTPPYFFFHRTFCIFISCCIFSCLHTGCEFLARILQIWSLKSSSGYHIWRDTMFICLLLIILILITQSRCCLYSCNFFLWQIRNM